MATRRLRLFLQAEEESMSKSKDDAPHELESQFVLRLPPVRDPSACNGWSGRRRLLQAAQPSLHGEHGGWERD